MFFSTPIVMPFCCTKGRLRLQDERKRGGVVRPPPPEDLEGSDPSPAAVTEEVKQIHRLAEKGIRSSDQVSGEIVVTFHTGQAGGQDIQTGAANPSRQVHPTRMNFAADEESIFAEPLITGHQDQPFIRGSDGTVFAFRKDLTLSNRLKVFVPGLHVEGFILP